MSFFVQRMSRAISPNFGSRATFGLRRCCRTLPALIAVFLLTVGPAQAEPVQLNQVVQTLQSLQGTTDIQLSLAAQDPLSPGTKTATQPAGSGGIGSSDPKLDALLSGFPIVAGNVDLGVDDFSEEGEVDGTICDCGEILIAGGGFPKWPLLFLTAVPLAFLPDCDDCEQNEPTPTPTPPATPTPTPPGVPEPASLILFGTGLLAASAGLRRRYNKTKLGNQNQNTEEGQS